MFKLFNEYKGGSVAFGDGNWSHVKAKGTVEIKGLPELCEVLFVKALKANLLSIIQNCDDDLIVQFSKKECNVFNDSGEWIMDSEKIFNNCYGTGLNTSMSCNRDRLDEVE